MTNKQPTGIEEIEKQLLELVGIANGTRAGQITHKIEEIKLMLETTRREAVKDFVNWRIEQLGADEVLLQEELMMLRKEYADLVSDYLRKPQCS